MQRWLKRGGWMLLVCLAGAMLLAGALAADWTLSQPRTRPASAATPGMRASQVVVRLVPLTPGPQTQAAISAEAAPNRAWAARLLTAPELEALSGYLSGTFPCRYEMGAALTVPDECFVTARAQYDLDKVLVWLQGQPRDGADKVLGLLPGYAYADCKPWLTGRARLGAPVAVISSWRVGLRLTEEDDGARWAHTQRRWHVVVCHELGHTFGLPHNPNRASLMFGGHTLEDLDAQSETLLKGDLAWLDAHSGVDWGS